MDTADAPVIIPSQLAAGFSALGVAAGQTVLLHASVKTVGWLLGGPHVILETLLRIIGPRGTLMMLASWEGNPYRMEQWPTAQRNACRAECPAFDPATSPADHREMSILAEYLRTWPGAYRSSHPLASFVAVGAQAEWLLAAQPLDYPHGVESPLARLCVVDGTVLLLGASFSNLTLLHHAEHVATLPQKRIERYAMPVVQAGHRVWVEIEEYDTTDGIANFGSDDYFQAIGEAYVASGKGSSTQIGRAHAYLFQADDLTQFGMQWMERHYRGPVPEQT